MRLHDELPALTVALALPAWIVNKLVPGTEAFFGVLMAVYFVEWALWEMHRNTVHEAYRRGRRDGAEAGPEKLMPVIDFEPTTDDLLPVRGVSSDLF